MSDVPARTVPAAARNGPLRVTVVSCYDYAWATVRELSTVEGVKVVGFVQADPPRARLRIRIRRFSRAYGPRMGLAAVASIARKVWSALGGGRTANIVTGVPHVQLESLNSPVAIKAVESLDADLMVVDGASILKPSFFDRPRYGAINLHCGKLPDYRGMPPAFWELYYGEREVGVSVHAVSAKLDEGAVFASTVVPLEQTPMGDPVAYVTRFWREQLRPVGIKLIAQTVRSIADGTAVPTPQGAASRAPFRSPSFREKRELRRRVARRRSGRRQAPGTGDA